MKPEQLAALVEILQRCPMTQAERLWVQALIDELAKPAPTEEVESNDQSGNG